MHRLQSWLSSWILGSAVGVSFLVGNSSQLLAWGHGHGHSSLGHHSFGHHSLGHHSFGHYGSSWGAYGLGGGFRSYGFGNGYSSFYGSSFFPFRTFSFYSPFYTSYSPFYASYYSPYYYAPVYYRSLVIPQVIYSAPCVTPVLYSVPRIPICVSKPTPRATLASVNMPAPSSRSRTSTASANATWLTSATEIIDMMVEKGGVQEGLDACEQLIRIRPELPGQIYWRAALLSTLSARDAHQIVGYIEKAEAASDRFDVHQLPGGSLRAYANSALTKSSIDEALNRLAKIAMQKENPTAEYRALSALLALDGQAERARVFLAASNSLPESPSANKEVQPATALASLKGSVSVPIAH